jgi:superfamily I DNA/RNA helicase
MQPTRGHDGSAIVPFRAADAEAEAAAVADSIVELRRRGVRYGDVALLFRSVATSTRPFIGALRARGIPFSCGGRSGLFQQPEVQAVAKAHLWLGGTKWWDEEAREEVALDPASLAAELHEVFAPPEPIDEIEGLLNDWASLAAGTSTAANLIDDFYRLLDGFEGFLSTSKYAKLAGCSADTALRDIRELVERRILVQNSASGRSTSYRLGEPEAVDR